MEQSFDHSVITHQAHISAESIPDIKPSPFIEANTVAVSLDQMQKEHTIPVFVVSNQPLISHVDFIELTRNMVSSHFAGEAISEPMVRVSHPVLGRVPEAKHKAAEDLMPWEKTLYYERLAFAIEIPSIHETIDGNSLSLTIGGVKSYGQDNLFSRTQSDQHFKLFIGFENKVCTNLSVWSDGLMADVRVRELDGLKMHLHHLLERYRDRMHLDALRSLVDHSITEQQFAQIIGKCRMYQHLPPFTRKGIPPLILGDQQLSAVVKDYYKDQHFSKQENGEISLWKLYNLLTGANKSSYIDSFLEKSVNAFDFVERIKRELESGTGNWYLN
jgi:hypothetical protein